MAAWWEAPFTDPTRARGSKNMNPIQTENSLRYRKNIFLGYQAIPLDLKQSLCLRYMERILDRLVTKEPKARAPRMKACGLCTPPPPKKKVSKARKNWDASKERKKTLNNLVASTHSLSSAGLYKITLLGGASFSFHFGSAPNWVLCVSLVSTPLHKRNFPQV